MPHYRLLATESALMAHSRWATHGANTVENAHPFTRHGLVMMHNGVVSNHAALNLKFNRTNEVDSLHFLDHMAGKLPFTDIQSYGTLVWVDATNPAHMFLGRLSADGQLAACKVKGGGVIWATLGSALVEATEAAGVEVEHFYEITPGQVYVAMNGKLYVEKDAPSILVSKREVVRNWEDYAWASPYDSDRGSLPVSQDELWADFEDKGETSQSPTVTDAEREDLKEDLAKWWLEDTMGVAPAAFDGMTAAEVLDVAVSFGFDADREVRLELGEEDDHTDA